MCTYLLLYIFVCGWVGTEKINVINETTVFVDADPVLDVPVASTYG